MKTKPTKASVADFIDAVADAEKREDARAVAALMAEVTGAPAQMWGASIVGFGRYRYNYASGRQGEFFETGFSPRKQALTLYIMPGFSECGGLLEKLGRHSLGKSCLYIKRLADIDLKVLRELVTRSVQAIREKHPGSG